MSNGITIIALGHANYGRMAFNLAVSIKNVEPATQIALVHNGTSLSQLYSYPLSKYFDEMILCPAEAYTPKGTLWYQTPCFIRAKTYLFDLSPFDNTLALDADTIWLPRKKPSELFKELESIDFTMANRGFAQLGENTDKKYSDWCDINDVHAEYGEGKFYAYHSEVMYFTKSEANCKFFETAKDIFDNCKIKTRQFAAAMADELPFAISSLINNHFPHVDWWLPEYWPPVQKGNRMTDQEMYNKFYLYSIGGNGMTEKWREIYDKLARIYFQKEGLSNPFQQGKRNTKKNFLTEREVR